ncbi:uncharacterized protein LOC144608261 [Rhinoraja longicauda]
MHPDATSLRRKQHRRFEPCEHLGKYNTLIIKGQQFLEKNAQSNQAWDTDDIQTMAHIHPKDTSNITRTPTELKFANRGLKRSRNVVRSSARSERPSVRPTDRAHQPPLTCALAPSPIGPRCRLLGDGACCICGGRSSPAAAGGGGGGGRGGDAAAAASPAVPEQIRLGHSGALLPARRQRSGPLWPAPSVRRFGYSNIEEGRRVVDVAGCIKVLTFPPSKASKRDTASKATNVIKNSPTLAKLLFRYHHWEVVNCNHQVQEPFLTSNHSFLQRHTTLSSATVNFYGLYLWLHYRLRFCTIMALSAVTARCCYNYPPATLRALGDVFNAASGTLLLSNITLETMEEGSFNEGAANLSTIIADEHRWEGPNVLRCAEDPVC